MPRPQSLRERSVRKNILFLHYGANWIRGSEIALTRLLQQLGDQNYHSHLICNQDLFANHVRENTGITTNTAFIPEIMIDGQHRKFQLLGWAGLVKKLVREIHDRKIDLLYCNSGITFQAGHYAAYLAGIPTLLHVHCPYNMRYIILYRLAQASRTVFVSRAIAEQITSRVRFRSPWEVIYNGVDTSEFHPPLLRDTSIRARFGIPEDALVIGQIGSLIKRKAPDIVLKACAEIFNENSDARLVLAGDGEMEHECRMLSNSLGIADRVVFTGFLRDTVPLYQHVLDINVLASRSEAMGITLLEAGACGIPSIASRVDGIPEALIEGTTGELFPKDDYKALAKHLRILAESRRRRYEMGTTAREWIKDNFSIERYGSSVTRCIDALISSSSLAATHSGML